MSGATSNVRGYWITWGVLLVITVIMLWLDNAAIGQRVLLMILLVAMAIKATLIAGHFMHLWHEHRGLILTVVVGLFAMGIVLYALIAPDALRIRAMAGR